MVVGWRYGNVAFIHSFIQVCFVELVWYFAFDQAVPEIFVHLTDDHWQTIGEANLLLDTHNPV